MKTENEIKALTLEERQKFVVELRQIKTSDRFYANAKALIEFATELKGWKEPETVKVTNIVDHVVTVDGKEVPAGAEAEVYPWQLASLGRFLAPLEKAAKKVAALLLFASLLAFGFTAAAQNQTTLTGGPGSYWVVSVAGLNGGTNYAIGTNTFTAPTTNFTYITNANWTLVNGLATNISTITTNTVVNAPGVVSVVNYDAFNIQWNHALVGAGTGNVTNTWDVSSDGVLWITNQIQNVVAAAGTALVGGQTNIVGVHYGYIRLNSIYNAATLTNIQITVTRKGARFGP